MTEPEIDKVFNPGNSKIAIAIVALVSLVATLLAFKLQFSYDIETFFSPQDPELAYYQNYRDNFENDNSIILLAMESDGGVFNTAFLTRLDSAVAQIESLPKVEFVTSPTRMHRYLMSPMGLPFRVPLLDYSDPEKLKIDSARIYEEGTYLSSFFAEDAQSISILLKARSHYSNDVHDELLSGVKKVLVDQGISEYHLAGRIIVENYYVNLIMRELYLFSAITFVLMIVFLSLIYKSPLGVVFPLVVIIVAGVWTMAFVKITGGSINLMLSMMPTILFVVCIGDSVHILNKFIYETRQGHDKPMALRIALKEVGMATFLTSVTTAIGFASLAFIRIPPLQQFGLYVAAGVMLTYIVTMILLPALLLIAPGSESFGLHKDKFDWPKRMGNFYTFIVSHSKSVLAISAVLMLVVLSGIPGVRVNNHFLDDLNEKSILKQDMRFFENHFSGIRALELGLEVKDPSMTLFDGPVLQEMAKVEDYLSKEYGAGFLWSPLNFVKLVNQVMHGGSINDYRIPDDSRTIMMAVKSGKLDVVSGMGQSFWTPDLRSGRFSGRIHDIGSAETESLNKGLQAFIKENTSLIDYHLTGSMHLVDNNNRHLSINMLKGLSISLVVVSIAVFLLFYNVRIALISLVPNIIPLLIVGGLMGWIGIDLKVPTAIIFTIAFGVAVDNTIHILSRLKIELGKGKPFADALYFSYLHTGKSVVLSALILIVGFLSFTLSDSKSTFTVGIMISVTLFVALWADLVILPLLLKRRTDRE